MPGTVVMSPGAKRKATMDKVMQGTRDGAGRAVDTVKGWSRKQQLIAGGGALAVILVLVLVFSLGGGGGQTPPPDALPAGGSQQDQSAVETQAYKGDSSVTVQVPKGWTRTAAGSYVDYVNPEDKNEKVRVLVESGSISPRKFADSTAPGTLKKSKNCAKPFEHLGTKDVDISGHAGAEFQYTCGAGDAERHGIWRMTTLHGKMYSFYMTTEESRFAASKKFYDKMAETYKLQ
jgi:hypothetical protein